MPRGLREQFADAFPLAVFLQGGNVAKEEYSTFANLVASKGYVVIIPDTLRSVLVPFSATGLFASVESAIDAVSTVTQVDQDVESPVYQIVNADEVALLAHSFGGAVAIEAANNGGLCIDPLCETPRDGTLGDEYVRPDAFKAGVFYGTTREGFEAADRDRDTGGVAIMLIQGMLDFLVTPPEADATFNTLERPHALVNVLSDHYAICNSEACGQEGFPAAAIAEGMSDSDRVDMIREIANFTVDWLRMHMTQPGDGVSLPRARPGPKQR